MARQSDEGARPGGDLVPVHGGSRSPSTGVSLTERAHFLREAAKLPSMRVSRADLSTVYRIADGTLSPLEGPMGGEAWHARARRARASRRGGTPLRLDASRSRCR